VWLVLCLNVSAGIGVIGMASPMLQEVFGGRLLGLEIPFEALDAAQLGRVAAMAAGGVPRQLLAPVTSPAAVTAMRPGNLLLLTGFWLFVTIPMGWGLWATIRQAAVLFW